MLAASHEIEPMTVATKPPKAKTIKKVKKQARVLDAEELSLLLHYAEPFADMYRLAYLTACRLSEIRELTAAAIKPKEIHIPQSKQGVEKRVKITPQLKDVLARLPKEGYLFPSATTGKAASRSAVHKHLKALAEDTGLDGVTTHSFRRSRATHCYRAKMAPKTIMKLTGHSDLATFLDYVDIGAEEVAEQVSELDSLLFPEGL